MNDIKSVLLPDEQDRLITFGGSVKALGNGVVGGHLVMFGSEQERDLHQEYFDKARTNFMIEDYPVKGERVLYNHGLDRTLSVKRIGQFDDAGVDDVGIWVRAQLDMQDAYQRAIYQLAEQGKLGWSSGALPQSVRTAEDGCIEQWAIIEGSLTPTPADFRNRARVLPVKALLEDTVELPVEQAEADSPSAPVKEGEAETPDADDTQATKALTTDIQVSGDTDMNKEKLAQVIGLTLKAVIDQLNIKMSDEEMVKATELAQAELAKAYDGKEEDEREVMKTATSEDFVAKLADIARQVQGIQEDQINSAVKSALANRKPNLTLPAASENGGRKATNAARINVSSRYGSMNVEDMAMAAFIKQQNSRIHGKQFDADEEVLFYRELADKAQKAISENKLGAFDRDSKAIKAVNAIKADELNYTTQVGFGDEWVAELWSNTLWLQDRVDNPVWSAMPVTAMPSNPYKLPIESTDPTVYRVPEANDRTELNPAATVFTTSKVATNNRTLTAYKMGVQVPYSAEMDEDSIIAFAPEVRRQAMEAMIDAVEYVLLNADNTIAGSPSGNINKYDAATQASDTDRWLLGFDGVNHLPLVGNTALGLDASGAAPTLSLLRQVRRLFPANRVGKLSELVYVTDPVTATKLLDIDEVLTMDKYGDRATVMTGEIARLDNIPILQTDQMPLADTNGKVSNTGSNNVYGRIALIHLPSWRVGYRRQIDMGVDFLRWADSYILTSTVRLALINRDTQASTLLYNLSI